ncbi:uncharacterized protein TNCV_3705761 [Trichonephila clavipes]|nr:uncharacterized protein TNCV_3705761 [Trichonephila clavipes]
MDPRDVIYTKTRVRTPSTDHSTRRPPHRMKCTCTANCFIGLHPDTGSIFTDSLCLLEPHEGTWQKDIWNRCAHYVFCPRRPPIDASAWSGASH